MSDVTNPDRIGSIDKVRTLEALFGEIDRLGARAGWIAGSKPLFWREPKSRYVPARWRYEEMKALMNAAGSLVDVSLSDRRNFVLRNPGDDSFKTTNTLVCAYQMILPKELAPSHRHSSHALRFIVDGKGTFSIVNGQKMPMETGDVVLTPGWVWHGHGHDGESPAYWVDVLDIPLTHLLESMFFEDHPDRYEKISSIAMTSPYRFSRDATMRGLDDAKPDPEGFHGGRISLPTPHMPGMMLTMERLHAGLKTRRQRSTATECFIVAQGNGETTIGAQSFSWAHGDVFVIPSWNKYEHHATADSVLFTISDEPLIRSSSYYRFQAD